MAAAKCIHASYNIFCCIRVTGMRENEIEADVAAENIAALILAAVAGFRRSNFSEVRCIFILYSKFSSKLVFEKMHETILAVVAGFRW